MDPEPSRILVGTCQIESTVHDNYSLHFVH